MKRAIRLKRKILALIEFNDSSGYLAEYNLKTNWLFTLTEMRGLIRKWLKRPIKRIKFLKGSKK